MAETTPHNTLGQFFALHLALTITSPILLFGHTTAIVGENTTVHFDRRGQWWPWKVLDQSGANSGSAATRPPWEDRHVPPPPPRLPPLPPSSAENFYPSRGPDPFEISICDLDECACKNRTKNGKELVDIRCSCLETQDDLKIRESMLPVLADTLEITDCDRVWLDGMASREETPDEDDLHVPGIRVFKSTSGDFLYARRKREFKVSDSSEESEADEGGVEWEEAVWEAELGSPDEEEQDAEEPPEEEEEEDSLPEGEESEKGGRYARAAPDLKKPPQALSSLTVRRARQLCMKPHAIGPVRSVLLEDVMTIRAFPPYAFQPPPHIPASRPPGNQQGEYLSDWTQRVQWEMDSVTFKNVSHIEKIPERAFFNVLIKSHFLWLRTNVIIMDRNAISVMFREADEDDSVDPCETSYRAGDGQAKEDVNATGGQSPELDRGGGNTASGNSSVELKTMCEASQRGFIVAESVISMWSMYTFSIIGAQSVIFDGCHISRLSRTSILVQSANTFMFTRNSVLESVSADAFSITAIIVEFRRNRFGRLEEGAMLGLTPNMASKTPFVLPHLTFEDNLLMDVDPLSLHSYWEAFMANDEVEGHALGGYSFKNNAFADCSCLQIGWIVQLTREQDASPTLYNFYTHVVNDESGNYCVREPVEPMGMVLPCRLPLKGIDYLLEEDGVTCKRHVDVVELCEMYQSAASSLSHSYYFQGLYVISIWTVFFF